MLIEFITKRDPQFFECDQKISCLVDIIGRSDSEILKYPPFRIVDGLNTPSGRHHFSISKIGLRIKSKISYFQLLLSMYFGSFYVKRRTRSSSYAVEKSNVKAVLSKHFKKTNIRKINIIYIRKILTIILTEFLNKNILPFCEKSFQECTISRQKKPN